MPSIAIRSLQPTDLPFGYQLSTAAGWNQLPADWQRALALDSSGSLIASLDGVDVGTVTAVVFDSIAWIGLMLVEPRARGRGVGRALMERVLDMLDARRVRSIRLDATPLGQPLYEKLGFQPDYQLQRYAGAPRKPRSTPAVPSDTHLSAATDSDLSRIAALDTQVTSTRRHRLLAQLRRERPQGARIAQRRGILVGFSLQRAGRLGTLVGPCIGDSQAGAILLAEALESLSGTPTLIDVPDTHAQSRALVAEFGLQPARPLTRMTRGEPVREDVARIWSSSGPEKG